MVHNEAMRQKYNCTLEFYKKLILEFSPDVICGEVHPSSWELYLKDTTYKGYRGEPASEYWELIFPLIEENNIEFIPVDWFELDIWSNFAPFINFTEAQSNDLKQKLSELEEKAKFIGSQCPIPFNSLEYDEFTKQRYNWLYQVSPDSTNVHWICRNQIMIQRIRNAVKKHKGKRILCTAGNDHNYCYYDGLKNEKNINLMYPLR